MVSLLWHGDLRVLGLEELEVLFGYINLLAKVLVLLLAELPSAKGLQEAADALCGLWVVRGPGGDLLGDAWRRLPDLPLFGLAV